MSSLKADGARRASRADGGDERAQDDPEPGVASASRYRLDADDRVTWVSGGWADFARRNAATQLRHHLVIGRPIWEFIHGPEMRDIYRALFDKVRSTGEALTVSAHCDAPDAEREMEIRIAPDEVDGLEVVATIVSERRRRPIPLLDHGHPRGEDLLSMCSWCRRVLAHPDRWLALEHAIEELELFSRSELPRLTHSACPDCYRRLMAAEGLDPA